MDAASILERFRAERRWTRRLISAIPEEHFDWRPADSAFSCGELVRHLMQAERFWLRLIESGARGENWDPFGYQGDAEQRVEQFRGLNEGAADDARLGSSFAECLERWASRQEETEIALERLLREAPATVSVHPVALLRGTPAELVFVMVSHEAHHRGQLSAYVKMLGLPHPPLYVATA